MYSIELDIEKPEAIQAFALQVTGDHPGLNVLINNAGIMRPENLRSPRNGLADSEATITTNLLGPIRLTAALLPYLQKQPSSTLINVTSGLAFVPLAMTPTYCATKAAIHSYTQSLRYQLRDTSVEVLELIPPYVQTELMRPEQANDPNAMPLGEFIAETMNLLSSSPKANEILVERVKPLRSAESSGGYDAFSRNATMPSLLPWERMRVNERNREGARINATNPKSHFMTNISSSPKSVALITGTSKADSMC